MNNHIVTLETAKRMKELGWSKECIFAYNKHRSFITGAWCYSVSQKHKLMTNILYAPLATEILEELPSGGTQSEELRVQVADDSYYVGYIGGETSHHKNLAEALCQLWIQLVEEGIIITNKE